MSNPELRLLTSQQPCPYIPGNTETLFHVVLPNTSDNPTRLKDSICKSVWSDFGEHGFRRQGRFIYRPVCHGCEECVATRVLTDEFEYRRRFRRIVQANSDIEVVPSAKPLVSESTAFALYAKYIDARHAHGAMYPPDIQTMRSMLHLEPDRDDFHVYGFLDNKVVFIAQTDRMRTGLSANYTIFDSDLSDRSLGTFAILSQIELCRNLQMPYLYLGFTLDTVNNMKYKKEFQPQERLIDENWVRND